MTRPSRRSGVSAYAVGRDRGVGVREAERLHRECDGEHVDARPDEERRRGERHPELREQNRVHREDAPQQRGQRGARGACVTPDSATNPPIARSRALPFREHDERELRAGATRSCSRRSSGRRAEERNLQKKREPLAELRRETRVGFALLLERCPHQQERRRSRTTYETASTRNGRPRERPKSAPPTGGATSRTVAARACVTLAAPGAAPAGRPLETRRSEPARKKHRRGRVDERDDDDRPEGRVVREHRRGEQRQAPPRPTTSAAIIRRLPVEAVGRHPGGQR